jgi:plasmid stabilization system protein ParE
MKRRWQPGVLDEVAGAILYLEGERPGLGTAFRASLERTLAFLDEYPLAAPVVHGSAHRALVHGFRTVVIYEPRGDELLIIAVVHTARDPETWKGRV